MSLTVPLVSFVPLFSTRRVPRVEQDLLTLLEHMRLPLVFGGVCGVYSLVFYVVSCVLLFVCLSFSFLAMALSVYFRFMSWTVPLVSFVPLFLTKLKMPAILLLSQTGLLDFRLHMNFIRLLGDRTLIIISRVDIDSLYNIAVIA